MPRPISNLGYVQLHLPPILEAEVDAWSKQGWAGVTQTTHDLLSYWFNRDEETEERFYFCQQRAVETVIYCHEVLRIRTLRELYEQLAPKALLQHLPLRDEVESIPFPKYSLKNRLWRLSTCRLCQLRCPLRFAEAFNPPGSYQNLLASQPAYRIFRHL